MSDPKPPTTETPRGEPPVKFDFFKTIQGYLEEASDAVGLEPYIRTILSQPKNEIIVNFPVRMDDGSVRLFKGYRVQHSNILGPFKGGIRYHEDVTLDDCKALAAMMTWKCALMRLPYGGGKGGVKFNPRQLSKAELQRVTRRFFFSLGSNIGPDFDIPAPDVGTNGQMMAWAMDTYANTVGHINKQGVKGVVTGKPVASGGTLGREKATGQGVVHCLTEWAQEKGFNLEGATMIVQGFGNVGSHTATILSRLGVSTIAVGDHTGYLLNPEGFNPHKLQDYVATHGSIAGYPNGKAISREEFFATKADIFVPAALENQIGVKEARAMDVKVVAEGANGPTNPAGEKVLLDRGIDILPDVLANAGGVTVSYFEWVQNKRSESWTIEEVDEKLETAMRRAYHDVVNMARAKRLPMRIAAYAVALNRIQTVYRERDIFPLSQATLAGVTVVASAGTLASPTTAAAPVVAILRARSSWARALALPALGSASRISGAGSLNRCPDAACRPTKAKSLLARKNFSPERPGCYKYFPLTCTIRGPRGERRLDGRVHKPKRSEPHRHHFPRQPRRRVVGGRRGV